MTATIDELLGATIHCAAHLEMRDEYMTGDPAFLAWRQDNSRLLVDDEDSTWWRSLVRATRSRGVAVQRARIVSEPLSDYTRFEHAITEIHNVAAGEDVRWLPRRQTTGLSLPGNDFWLFDGKVLLVNHFSGSGDWMAKEYVTDEAVIEHCRAAFDQVWQLAVPHADYRPGS